MTDINHEDAFEALQRFAAVWHDKYAHANGGENRKPPSLTMRAGETAALLTEPQLRAVVAESVRMRDELECLRSQLGDPEIQWGHQIHADGHRGDEVPQADERAARHAVAYLNKRTLPADARAVLIQREVRTHEGKWRMAPVCECPHDDQPDGRLVRDGVLALGCPVHDPDGESSNDAEGS